MVALDFSTGVGGRRTYFRLRPLNELCRSRPSEVMSRYSTSAKKVGSTHVAFGFLIGFVSLDFGLTTVSSCFLIWLETVRDQPVPTLTAYRFVHAADVPDQRSVEFTGQSLRLFNQRRDDAFGILVRDLDQHHVARMTLDERCNIAVPGPAAL
jgi:hypothetical protein